MTGWTRRIVGEQTGIDTRAHKIAAIIILLLILFIIIVIAATN